MLMLVALCEERAVRVLSCVCTRSSVTVFLSIIVRACSYIYVSSSMLALPEKMWPLLLLQDKCLLRATIRLGTMSTQRLQGSSLQVDMT